MKIDTTLQEYLNGDRFDSGKLIDFSEAGYAGQRMDCVSEIIKSVENCRIVHLGACDHKDLIENKRRNKTWVHELLMNYAERVIGIDINEEAVQFCQKEGIDNIICANVLKDEKYIREKLIQEEQSWDYLFAGEVLEHIDDPVNFLKTIKEKYRDMIKGCIITVPNCFRYENFKFALKGQEGINTDHRYWFSPYTLCKVCYQAGIKVEELYLTDCSFGRFRSVIHKFYPSHMFYGNIVVVGRFY